MCNVILRLAKTHGVTSIIDGILYVVVRSFGYIEVTSGLLPPPKNVFFSASIFFVLTTRRMDIGVMVLYVVPLVLSSN